MTDQRDQTDAATDLWFVVAIMLVIAMLASVILCGTSLSSHPGALTPAFFAGLGLGLTSLAALFGMLIALALRRSGRR